MVEKQKHTGNCSCRMDEINAQRDGGQNKNQPDKKP
jgi:hypothetical protein